MLAQTAYDLFTTPLLFSFPPFAPAPAYSLVDVGRGPYIGRRAPSCPPGVCSPRVKDPLGLEEGHAEVPSVVLKVAVQVCGGGDGCQGGAQQLQQAPPALKKGVASMRGEIAPRAISPAAGLPHELVSPSHA